MSALLLESVQCCAKLWSWTSLLQERPTVPTACVLFLSALTEENLLTLVYTKVFDDLVLVFNIPNIKFIACTEKDTFTFDAKSPAALLL